MAKKQMKEEVQGRLVLPIRELYKVSPEEMRDKFHTDLEILFEDDVIIPMTNKEIILTRFLLELFTTIPDLKIVSKYSITNYYTNGYLTSKTINNTFEKILEDIINIYCKPTNDRSILNNVLFSMQQLFNYIYNKLTYPNQSYCNSIHIHDLLNIQLEPELVSAIKEVEKDKSEAAIKKAYKVLDNIIRTSPKCKNNAAAIGYITGSIKANQVQQLLACRGSISELTSHQFRTPVASSFTLGMNDIYEMAIESRSGANALDKSHKSIRESEYVARRLQLIAMTVERLVDGDCGSKDYLLWKVRPAESGVKNSKSDLAYLIGKFYLNEETGQEEVITSKHTHLENQVIKLRSALNCKLPDKNAICSKCFGELSYGILPHFNLGHYCTTVMTQKLTQSLLSTKHLMGSATSTEFALDAVTEKIFDFKKTDNCFYFKKEVLNSKNKWDVIISQNQALGINLITSVDKVKDLSLNRVSRLAYIQLRSTNEATGEVNEYQIEINKEKNRYGYLTYEFLTHFVSNKDYSIDSLGNYVISLTGFNYRHPFIILPGLVYDFSILVKAIRRLFSSEKISSERSSDTEKEDKDNKSPEGFLQDLFDMVNNKNLDINLALLEVMTYAVTVADEKAEDFSLGRFNKNRTIIKTNKLIKLRSLGAVYGWEKLYDTVLSPKSFYSYNAVNSPMDVVIKPQTALRF